MKLNKLIIENFKGIASREEFEIRSITIFCGPNSSGKSSCLHALAALAQSVKLSNSQVPVVLDDEYAQVHLGRYLDVIHSKSIEDSFSLGIGVSPVKYIVSAREPNVDATPNLEIEVEFKASGVSQEIFIQSADVAFLNEIYHLERKPDDYFSIKKNNKPLGFHMESTGKFGFRPKGAFEDGKPPKGDVLQAFFLGENINRNIGLALSNVFYLGPFRQGPLRRYPTRGAQPQEVGASGEAAVQMLANEFSKSTSNGPNITQISRWIAEMGLGKKVELSPIANTDLFDVNVHLDDGASLPLPDLGYGMSQVLPVLVQCSFAPEDSTLLFEQPELHLHQGAAKRLGGVLAEIVKRKNINIIIETHSRDLVNEILQNIKSGNLDREDFVLYDVCRTNGKSTFKKVIVEAQEDGDFWIDHPWFSGMEK